MKTITRQIFSSVGFGLERLGLLSLHFPRIALILTALAFAAFSYCSAHLQFDSDARVVFRSESADYLTLERVTNLYPPLVNQVLIIVEGKPLKNPNGLEALRSLHLELELTEKVEREPRFLARDIRHRPATNLELSLSPNH